MTSRGPRGQWMGLLCPEDRPEILARYKRFGLQPSQARGFGFVCHLVGENIGTPLPEDLGELAFGRRVISFRAVDDEQRCTTAAGIIRAIFQVCMRRESDRPRVLLVIEEDTRFTRKGVPGEAYVYNPEWGVAHIAMRPPLSRVGEPSEEQLRTLLGGLAGGRHSSLSDAAQAVLTMAQDHYCRTGQAVKLSVLVAKLGITSRRRVGELVTEIERSDEARFERLAEQGRPLVIVPTHTDAARTNRA